MTDFFLTLRRSRRVLAAVALCVAPLLLPAEADAQSVATKYQRAQAREKTARAAKAPSPATLRAIAKTYEAIVRAHPKSGYADNALWQAAGVLTLAYQRSGATSDREQARQMLTWLKKEYPTGALAKQANAKIAALAPPARATAPPAAPAATAPADRPAATPATPAAKPAAPAVASAAPRAEAPVAALPKVGAASVRTITHSVLPKGDRLTIELNAEAPYTTSRADNPDRVTLDLSNAFVTPSVTADASDISGALLKSLRVSKGDNDSARIVLELNGRPRFSTFPLYDPFRLVIDVESATPSTAWSAPRSAPSIVAKASTRREAPAARATPVAIPEATPPAAPAAAAVVPAPPPAPRPVSPASTSRGDYSLARQLGLGVSRIVIDPGHGGHDPGAKANGINEADLVLDLGLRLERLLTAQPGFDVVLTRRTDQFIPLEERTAIANRETADMFISIHANASRRVAARGIETYILNFASNPDAEAVAARENASSAQTMRKLPELVKTIALTNKLDESRELAGMVQSSLVGKLTPHAKGLKDLGVKQAPFVVLIGAQMPSVLAEVSFLTNRSDAALLKQSSYRQRIAQALFDSVMNYQRSLKKVTTVTAQSD